MPYELGLLGRFGRCLGRCALRLPPDVRAWAGCLRLSSPAAGGSWSAIFSKRMAVSLVVARLKGMGRMRSCVSVCASDTGMPLSKPSVTKRCSSYLKRSSSNVNVGRSNTFCASTKSMPWSLRFCSLLTSSHSNCIYGVYIRWNQRAPGGLAAR